MIEVGIASEYSDTDSLQKHGKQCLHISKTTHNPAGALRKFVEDHGIRTLNVAGSRKSKDPGIHQWGAEMLGDAFFPMPGANQEG